MLKWINPAYLWHRAVINWSSSRNRAAEDVIIAKARLGDATARSQIARVWGSDVIDDAYQRGQRDAFQQIGPRMVPKAEPEKPADPVETP